MASWKKYAADAADENAELSRATMHARITDLQEDKARLAAQLWALQQAVLKLLDKVERARNRKAK
ncbi:MAG: hypothetical protein ABSB33_11935 [Tepidisphaeraceae bacterium]|jgi:hypothetical protein